MKLHPTRSPQGVLTAPPYRPDPLNPSRATSPRSPCHHALAAMPLPDPFLVQVLPRSSSLLSRGERQSPGIHLASSVVLAIGRPAFPHAESSPALPCGSWRPSWAPAPERERLWSWLRHEDHQDTTVTRSHACPSPSLPSSFSPSLPASLPSFLPPSLSLTPSVLFL